jgi:GT2 family glycosyltransferase
MIVIIAVSYFGSTDLGPYLLSLQEQSTQSWHLVVVDNSEDEAEHQALREVLQNESRTQLLRASTNLGYLGGGRWGRQESTVTDADWIIISNTDIRLGATDTLAQLAAITEPSVGIVAPSIKADWDGRDQNPYKAARPTPAQMKLRVRVLSNPVLAQTLILVLAMRRKLSKNYSAPKVGGQIYAPHGSFVAFGRTFFDQGGHLDFPLFLFGEEIFLAEQSLDLGIQVLYAPQVRVEHVEHRQTGYWRSLRMLRLNAEAVRYCHDLIRGSDRSDRSTSQAVDSNRALGEPKSNEG